MNAVSGCLSIVFAFSGNLMLAGLLILIAAIFDFFDGMLARLLKAYSEIGKELDSLADDISFGVAPSVIAFILIRNNLCSPSIPFANQSTSTIILCLLPFTMAAFSALRLAKFNIDTRQTDKFIGLPTPANAMVWASIPFIAHYNADCFFVEYIMSPYVLIALSLVMSGLLVCELPLFSLKFKKWDFASNKVRYLFLFASLLLIVVMQFASIPAIILLYVIVSIFFKV